MYIFYSKENLLLPPPPSQGSIAPLDTKETLFTGGAILIITSPVKSGSLVAKGAALPSDGGGGTRGKQRRMGGGEGMGGGGAPMQSTIRMFYLPIK